MGNLHFFIMNFKYEKYSLDLINEPDGWNWEEVELRYTNIPYELVGPASTGLLSLALKKWKTDSGKEAPRVTITRVK